MQITAPNGCDGACVMDAILDTYPALRGTTLPDGSFTDPLLAVQSTKTELRIDVPDEWVDRVTAVVTAHDPKAPAKGADQVAKRAAALQVVKDAAKDDPKFAALVQVLGL